MIEKIALASNGKFHEQKSEIGQMLANQMKELISKIPSSVSYDDQICEIKKDITTILSLVHTQATQNPDSEKMNSKIKMMENSIAQIYTLLKKYENGL